MSEKQACVLGYRAVLRLAGPDLRTFLQGIVSTDVTKVGPERSLWAAFLTPQGKFLHEFFMAEVNEALLLECEAERLGDLKRRLSIYRLRSKVEIEDVSEHNKVVALFGQDALAAVGLPADPGHTTKFANGVAFTDPRLAELGARAILPSHDVENGLRDLGFAMADAASYDRLRIGLGVPDGSRDLEVERSILLENGFDELHGVDWAKGCFMGQELTARTKYRGLVKKRLLPVSVKGPLPDAGTPVELDGKEVGTMRSSVLDVGLATLRLEYLNPDEPQCFTASEAELTPQWPAWIRLPAASPTSGA